MGAQKPWFEDFPPALCWCDTSVCLPSSSVEKGHQPRGSDPWRTDGLLVARFMAFFGAVCCDSEGKSPMIPFFAGLAGRLGIRSDVMFPELPML